MEIPKQKPKEMKRWQTMYGQKHHNKKNTMKVVGVGGGATKQKQRKYVMDHDLKRKKGRWRA